MLLCRWEIQIRRGILSEHRLYYLWYNIIALFIHYMTNLSCNFFPLFQSPSLLFFAAPFTQYYSWITLTGHLLTSSWPGLMYIFVARAYCRVLSNVSYMCQTVNSFGTSVITLIKFMTFFFNVAVFANLKKCTALGDTCSHWRVPALESYEQCVMDKKYTN